MATEKTIVLVDDERDIRELFSLVLESAGYAVIAVAHAQDVLDILATRQVALLITDYHMPEMNGATLITSVRALHPRLPMILASGQRGIAALAASSGANGHYQKGLPISCLLGLVAVLLQECSEEDSGDILGDQ